MAIFLLKANHGYIESEKHIFEGDSIMINLNTKNENIKLSGDSSIPAETT